MESISGAIKERHRNDFVSKVYYQINNGKKPTAKSLLDDMDENLQKTIGENVIEEYKRSLIQDNINRRFIFYDIKNDEITLTSDGMEWALKYYFNFNYSSDAL